MSNTKQKETIVSQDAQALELQTIQAKQAADFSLTQVGQIVKQFEVEQRMAQMYTQSTIVPDTFRGNIGNCVIGLDIAMRMNITPLMVLQNLYIVHGTPAFSSKFLIACINASKRFSPLRYQFKGTEGSDDYACRCIAYEASDREHKEPLEGEWISIALAKKEGWYGKNGSKWQTMPAQMMRYRAAAFWQRVYCPEISMGFITKEEADDIQDVPYEDVSTRVANEIKANANAEEIDLKLKQDDKEIQQEQPTQDAKVASGEEAQPGF